MLDRTQIDKAIEKAFAKTADRYGEAQIEQIKAWVWEWDGVTLRQNGQVVGSPRDIVDTGELRDSLVQSRSEHLKRDYHYTANHATEVHEGAGRKLPRPWTERARQEDPLEPVFAEALKEEL